MALILIENWRFIFWNSFMTLPFNQFYPRINGLDVSIFNFADEHSICSLLVEKTPVISRLIIRLHPAALLTTRLLPIDVNKRLASVVCKRVIVWRNFSILSPKLVLAYAENILSDSRLKNCDKSKSGWCKSVGVERFEIWVKKDFLVKKVHLAC